MSSLNDGLTSLGATSRTFDKYGKRIWVSDVKKDLSKKDTKLSVDKPAVPFDSDTRTSEVRC